MSLRPSMKVGRGKAREVDGSVRASYVQPRMNLLLLLSALLSALTGVGASVRGVEPAAAVAGAVARASTVVARAPATSQRPVGPLPTRVTQAFTTVVLPAPPAPAVPAYFTRRRE